jgi:RHS repeat-associated protein
MEKEEILYFFHTNHLGSSSYITNFEGKVTQHIEYFASGEQWLNQSNTSYNTRYTFTGKEQDTKTGYYYHGARYYNPRHSTWLSPDPILSSYMNGKVNGGVYNSMNLSLYAYGANNPVKYVDLDGNEVSTASTAPKQVEIDKNVASVLGGGKVENSDVGNGVLKKLTFIKARNHYIANTGKPLSVDASSVDLSKVDINDFKYLGHSRGAQLFFNGNEYSSNNDALVYGGITLVYAGGNQVAIKPDYYNFEMHDWGTSIIRNLGTIGGRISNMDILGMRSGYTINFVGTATVGGN